MRIDLQNEKHIKELRKKIRHRTKKFNFNEEELEDCTQELLKNWIEGRGQKQTLDQFIIDYLRKSNGRKGTRKRAYGLSSESYSDEICAHQISIYGNNELSVDNRRLINEIIATTHHWKRAILILNTQYGYEQAEIGYFFGVSESRVCQWIKEIQSGISKKIKTESKRQKKESNPVEKVLFEKTKRIERQLEPFENRRMEKEKPNFLETFNEEGF